MFLYGISMLLVQGKREKSAKTTVRKHICPNHPANRLGQRPHITIFGEDYDTPDGTCIRDYVHVEDLINAHLLALDYLRKGGKSDIFNLGSNQGFSVKEMIDTAER